MNRTYHIAFLLIISFLFVNCNSEKTLATKSNTLANTFVENSREIAGNEDIENSESAELNNLSATDKDARNEAQKYFDSVISKCDQSLLTVSPNNRGYDQVTEFREIKIKVNPRALNEADNLNNVKWDGEVIASPTLYRRYDHISRKWQDWEQQKAGQQEIVLNLKKKNEVWETKITPRHTKIECEELPWKNTELLDRQNTEVTNLINSAFEKLFNKCGDYYYARAGTESHAYVAKATGYKVALYPQLLTKARTGNTQWEGEAKIFLENSETASFWQSQRPRKEWRKEPIEVTFEGKPLSKVNNKWEPIIILRVWEPIGCNDL